MNSFESGIRNLFALSANPDQQVARGRAAARIHATVLAAIRYIQPAIFEPVLLGEEELLDIYQGGSDSKDPAGSIEDFLNASLGEGYAFHFDSTQRLHLDSRNNVYSLYPFFIVEQNEVCYLVRVRPGSLQYSTLSGEIIDIDARYPMMDQIADSLLEKSYYRALIVCLRGLPSERIAQLEHRIYSAHCFLGCEHYKNKRYRDAVAEFEKALQIKSNMPQLYYNLSLSYAKLDRQNLTSCWEIFISILPIGNALARFTKKPASLRKTNPSWRPRSRKLKKR